MYYSRKNQNFRSVLAEWFLPGQISLLGTSAVEGAVRHHKLSVRNSHLIDFAFVLLALSADIVISNILGS